MHGLAAALVAGLVGYPFAILPSKAVALAGAAALALYALGLSARSTRLLAAGVSVAVGQYALAVGIAGGPPRLAGAALAGVGAALALQVGDFAARSRGVRIGPGVIPSQLGHWARLGALGGGAALVLAAAATAIASAVALPWTPVLAAAGAVAALGAAAIALERAGGPGAAEVTLPGDGQAGSSG